MPDHHHRLLPKWKAPDIGGRGGGGSGGSSRAVIGMRSGENKDLEGSTVYSSEALGCSPSDISESDDDGKHRDNLPHTPFVDLSVGSPAKTDALAGMETGEEKYPKWQFVEALGPSPSDIRTLLDISKSDDYSKHRDDLPHKPFVDLSVGTSAKSDALNGLLMRCMDPWIDSPAKTDALARMETGEEKDQLWQLGSKSKHTLRLQRAWVVHSAWASIENVCKISSSLLVNKFQCEHIAEHFKVIGDVLEKLGLGKDFVSDSQALEGSSSIQANLTFDEVHFSHIAKTFNDCGVGRFSFLETQIQDMSSMFEDYIRDLLALDRSSEESLSKKPKINEGFKDFSLQGMSSKESVEVQSRYCIYHPLDQFLGLLLGVLKRGEDLVLFHSGLEGANNGVVEWTGLHGEKFVKIHELLYKLLDFYACLHHCKGTEFASGYLFQCDSCRVQSLLYYFNSNCLGKNASLSIDFKFLTIELATTLSELLERPNCAVKTLCIESSSRELCQESLQWRLMVIAALNKCVSIRSLTIGGLNEEEVHQLYKSLSINKVLENLVISTSKPFTDKNAMDLSALLKENHSLKSFTFKSNNISSESVYFGPMLAENSSLEELNLQCRAWDEIMIKHFMLPLMNAIDGEPQVNFSLKRLHIDIIGGCLSGVAEIIAQLLRTNKTLTHFSIEFGGLDQDSAYKILNSLKKNRSLQVLGLLGWSSFDNDYEVATSLEAMMAENSTLQELKVDMHMWNEYCLKHLLRPLMANKDRELHVNISLRQLHIINCPFRQVWKVAKSIAQMLRTNETLSHFSMINVSLEPSDVCEILDSLKFNKALQMLNLDKCEGLDDPRVKVAFMDLLVNYNFTLSMIRMHGIDWDIEAFMKSKLEIDTTTIEERTWGFVGGISKSTRACDLKQTLENFQEEKGEGSNIEVHGFSMKAFEELQEELVGRCPSKPKVISTLKSKLEIESEQSLQDLKPILEAVMKSTNFLLRRNLNMAQLLQERYTQWNSFLGMYASKLIDEEKDELNKGCIIASLFPTTFLYHLKSCLLQESNSRGILHTLKEVVHLVVQRVKSLQDSGSQTFWFIDYVDVQHIYSPRKTIAICQTFSTNIGIIEEFQVENSIQYGIVQDHLSGAYYFDSDKVSNLDKSVGVIGVKVTSIEIHVEIMWEDGSYYSGALEDFSYDLEPNDNKHCALEAFGDLKGAHFLKTHGLKCSPLLVIALAMAIHNKGLTLTWKKGKGHIEIDSILPFLKPMELEVWECQILYGDDINQLGEIVEWGMNQLDHNCASSKRVCRNNQSLVVLEHGVDGNIHISNISNDTSIHTQSNVDLSAVAAQFHAGAQNKQKYSIGVKVLGSGGDIGFEKQNSKGKKVEDQSFKKMQELYWEEKGGYVIGKLNDRHELLEEKLRQGSLYAERDLNYLVVYDGCTASHVSIYWVKEWIDEPRLELEWITDIFINKGPEEIKSIFKGLKGETLEVTRIGTQFLENPSQQQSKGLMKRFINRLSNKGSCKGNGLQMVSKFEDPAHLIFEGCSNDEWEHIVGIQPDICSNKCWWKASYMQAITYSRTRYSSGYLLSTHKTEKCGLKLGSCRRFRLDGSNHIHKSDVVKSCGKFSKPPQSLSSKWHEMIHWGGLKESLV